MKRSAWKHIFSLSSRYSLSPLTAKEWTFLAACCVFSFLTQVALLYWVKPNIFTSFEHGVMAFALAHRGQFYYVDHLSAWRAPLYVIFLAALVKYLGLSQTHYLFAFYFNIVVTSLFPIPVYKLAKLLFSPPIAVISVLVLITDWYVITQSLWLLPEVFFAGVILLVLVNLYKLEMFQLKRFAVVSGLLVGIGALMRGVLLFFIPAALLWIHFRRNIAFRKRLVHGALIVGFCALTLAPWTIRNYMLFGKIVLIDTSFGFNLWVGNSELATGSIASADGRKFLWASKEMAEETKEMNEAERSDYFLWKALQFIRDNPADFVVLRLKALFYFWFTYNYWHTSRQSVFSRTDWIVNDFPREVLVIFNLLVFIGLFVSIKDRKPVSLLVGLVASFSLIYSLFHAEVNLRYCAPLHPVLCLFAAYALHKLYFTFVEKRRLRRLGG